MTQVSFSCRTCGAFVSRPDRSRSGGYCSPKCSAHIRHAASVSRNRFAAMCTSTDPVEGKINLAPDCSAIDALPVLIQEALWTFLLHVAVTCCTARQAECIRLHFGSGLTQREVAKEIGLNQSTVAHTLYGIKLTSNREYDARYQGKYYGGAIRSIRKQLLTQAGQAQLNAVMTGVGALSVGPALNPDPPDPQDRAAGESDAAHNGTDPPLQE